MLEGILMDMDGTLVDSEKYWMIAEKDLTNKFNVPWTHKQGESLKGTGMEISVKLFQGLGVKMERQEIIDFFNNRLVELTNAEVCPEPGVIDFLIAAKRENIKIAMVTSSYKCIADAVVTALTEQTGAPDNLFDAIVSGDIVTKDKPEPEPYLMGAEKIGVDIKNCVGCEDSVLGGFSVKRSGAKYIAYKSKTKGDLNVNDWSKLTISDVKKLWQ